MNPEPSTLNPEPTPRMRGRQLQQARARLFAVKPWCERCLEDGRQVRATIRSHVVPLTDGGADDETNEQALCLDCEDAKKAIECAPSQLQDRFRKSATPRDQRGQFSVRPTSTRGRWQKNPDVPPDESSDA